MLDGGIFLCYNGDSQADLLDAEGKMPFATIKTAPREKLLSGGRLRYLQLWDAYGPLLTDTQREICEKYYLYDLSLSEIAEEKGISKQAVSDALKKSRELLDFYEEKLHFNEQNQAYSLEVSRMMTRVTRALEAFGSDHPALRQEIDEIIAMVAVGETIGPDEEN